MAERTSHNGARDLARLLPAPHVALQFLAACQDLSGAKADLREIVLQDATLCTRIIAAAARIRSGGVDPAAPLSSALAALDPPLLRSIALQAARTVVDTPLDAVSVQFLRELWFYSQAAGELAASLAEAAGYPDPEEARLAGLLLNVGMLALFSAHPESYPHRVGTSQPGPTVRGREQGVFDTDHCLVGAALVEAWNLDTFLPEALRFAYLEPAACRESALLVRITRLTSELVRQPLLLGAEAEPLAAQLIGLDAAGLEAAFSRADRRYRPLAPFDGRQEECRREMVRVRRQLTAQVFALADREGIQLCLDRACEPDAALETARTLYLYHSPAREVVFFLADTSGERFAGLGPPAGSRRAAGLITSLDGGNLLARALRSGRTEHSFGGTPADLAVFDRQLIHLCGSPGIACLPLQDGERPAGGVVLGLESREAVDALDLPRLHHLGRTLGRVLSRPGKGGPGTDGEGEVRLRKLAHEIRTPLAVVRNYLNAVGMLLEGSENAEVVEAMEAEIRRIGELVAYHAEPAAAEAPLQDPRALVQDVLESLAPSLCIPRRIEVVTDFGPPLDPLPLNPLALRQVLVNLLTNAAEALTEGGRIIVGTREVRGPEGDRQLAVSVQDNGPGLPPAVKERLFEPVVSTKGEGHAGLGLNIVKGLVDDLGGRISCESSPAQGTRFDIFIPRAPVENPATEGRSQNSDGE